MYQEGRFFTVTGQKLDAHPSTIVDITADVLQRTYDWIAAGPPNAPAQPTDAKTAPHVKETADTPSAAGLTASDNAVLARMLRSPKVRKLWEGDWKGCGYKSQSEGDGALVFDFAHTTHDPDQLDRLFRASKLFRAEKWDKIHHHNKIIGGVTYERLTYGQKIILDAIDKVPLEATLPYSDYTNALGLVRQHGDDLHYCYLWKSWLVWTGSHWEKDSSGAVMRMAKETIKGLAQHAADLEDTQAVKALMTHVKNSLATTRLKAMVESAQSEPSIAVQPEDCDRDTWLLNMANGTLNLRTGQLRTHQRGDLLTRCLPVVYDPAATCPTWHRFLWRVMGGPVGTTEGDAARATALMTFLQRAVGYALTGETSEQCLFLLHGSGANGKTTFIETLRALLGDYAQATPSATLLAKDWGSSGIPNDVARLQGARLVTACEIGEGKKLNEELVKRLVGGDTLTARFLHQEFFEFTPQFKLCVACNHLPQIRGMDHAIWRRIQLVPFTVTIPNAEQDKDLLAKLKAELSGILAWAVQGCLDWQRDGLGMPGEVIQATEAYRQEMDTFGRFLAECCVSDATADESASILWSSYNTWCEINNEAPLTRTAFGRALTEKGYPAATTGHANTTRRLGLRVIWQP